MSNQVIEEKVGKRGRKSKEVLAAEMEAAYIPIYQREFKNKDGSRDIWFYNLDKCKYGPIRVEYNIVGEYKETVEPKYTSKGKIEKEKKGKKSQVVDLDRDSLVNNMDVKKTKRLYIHPTNGKIISYTRAHNLGLI